MNTGFFFRPGVDDVLGGLAHHAFVLGLMLILTSGSRTVSLSILGIFWLIGVWSVFGLTYLVQDQIVSLFGVDIEGQFMSVWLAPFTEEALKLAPVAVFLLLAVRSGHHPSVSDGLLLGFMVGAGVTFQEDAHYGKILGSGDGWSAATPWSLIFPTISPLGEYFALNHALWGALSGLSIGVAVMLRHWRWTWPIALAGPLLAFTNHLMANHYAVSEFGISFLLRRASGGEVPWFFDTIRTLTAGGRAAMLALILGAVLVVVGEWLILRWAGKRDRLFRPLPLVRLFGLIAHAASKAGAGRLLAADRYLRLRRSPYFAAWAAVRAGGFPRISDADFAQLLSAADQLGILPQPAAAQPASLAPADVGTSPGRASATVVAPVSEASAGDVPPAG